MNYFHSSLRLSFVFYGLNKSDPGGEMKEMFSFPHLITMMMMITSSTFAEAFILVGSEGIELESFHEWRGF